MGECECVVECVCGRECVCAVCGLVYREVERRDEWIEKGGMRFTAQSPECHHSPHNQSNRTCRIA